METLLILATAQGLAIYTGGPDNWHELRRTLTGQTVTSVIARESVILAGRQDGVFRSDDLGETWRPASAGMQTLHVRWLAYHPDISDFELAGTEPAAIYISRDGAVNWRDCPEVAGLRQRYGWYLPYSPAAGCVRGFAFHGERGYAAVEDGGVLVSSDGGGTWRLADGSRGEPDHTPLPGHIHSDLHSIEVHPSSADLVFAPTGGGFYYSDTGGRTWSNLYPRCYCRAAWVDPADPRAIVLGPADGVDRNGRIESSRDGGRTWQPASTGLDTPWPRTMVERFALVSGRLLAVLSNGQLFAAEPGQLRWQRLLPEVAAVTAVTSMEVEG